MSKCLVFFTFGGIVHGGVTKDDGRATSWCTSVPANVLRGTAYDPAKVTCKRCRKTVGLEVTS